MDKSNYIEQLKWGCKTALIIIDAVAKENTSPIVLRILDQGRDEVITFKDELSNPALTFERAVEINQQIIERFDALGKDLISYGVLIIPPDPSN